MTRLFEQVLNIRPRQLVTNDEIRSDSYDNQACRVHVDDRYSAERPMRIAICTTVLICGLVPPGRGATPPGRWWIFQWPRDFIAIGLTDEPSRRG